MVLSSCAKNVINSVDPDPMVFSALASHSTKGIITTTSYPLDEPFVVKAVHYPKGLETAESTVLINQKTVQYDFDNGLWKTDDTYMYANDPASSTRKKQKLAAFENERKQFFIFYR